MADISTTHEVLTPTIMHTIVVPSIPIIFHERGGGAGTPIIFYERGGGVGTPIVFYTDEGRVIRTPVQIHKVLTPSLYFTTEVS